MASIYSNYLYNGAAWIRLRVDITNDTDAPVAGQTSVGIGGSMWLESRYSVIDTSNSGSFTWPTGSWAGSTNVNHGASGGQTLLLNFGSFYAVGAAPYTIPINGSISGINAVPGTVSISFNWTVPGISASVPGTIPAWSASPLTQTSVLMNWITPPANGSPVDLYAIRLWDSAHSLATPNFAVESSVGPVSAGGLWPSTTYSWAVAAHNAVGWGEWAQGPALVVSTKTGAAVNVAGSNIPAKVHVRVGGAWRTAKVWKNVGGAWVL